MSSKRETKYLEVRCCCDADRLYGWLPGSALDDRNWPLDGALTGIAITLPMLEHPDPLWPSITATTNQQANTVQLTPHRISRSVNSCRDYYTALRYDDDTTPPTEKYNRLRRLRGFLPNPHCFDPEEL